MGQPMPDDTPPDTLPDRARKGRGAVSNRGSRYDAETRVAIDDGWSVVADDDLPPLRTTVTPDATRTIIARNDSPDIGFDRSINPYRGCEHGCVYCFARPTHAYLGLSPGLDFETRLTAKFDGPALLERELRAKNYRCAVMAMGTNTDPYQPIEREHRITRRVLEVLAAFNHPVGIVTKSALVTRDLDILAPMAAKGLATVLLSVTTLDGELARTLEPRASTPRKRLAAIEALARAGVPTGVMTAPMIPALNDSEMEAILAAAHAAGATRANFTLLRLPLEIKDLFAEWLATHAPGKAQHVLSLIRQSRSGRLNDPDFHSRFVGTGAYAQMMAQRFKLACRKLGLNKTPLVLDTTQFRPPPRAGDQLALL
ncbi:MAG TPA: PA0069 family radical SAM protein [Candidatus Sulfotelmatobacter sp.]|nr:PA0069 family radical SAM protein [Candidatus Sulfotelmatobacter sp.]